MAEGAQPGLNVRPDRSLRWEDLFLFAGALLGLLVAVWLFAKESEAPQTNLAVANHVVAGIESLILYLRLRLHQATNLRLLRLSPASLFRRLPLTGSECVLCLDDLAGSVSVALARQLPSGQVTEVVDWSGPRSDVWERAYQQRAAAAGIGDRLDFRYMNGEHLPAYDHAFDVIYLSGMPLMPSEKFVSELQRVLRPGGRICVDGPRRSGLTRLLRSEGLEDAPSPLPFLKVFRKRGHSAIGPQPPVPVAVTFFPFEPTSLSE